MADLDEIWTCAFEVYPTPEHKEFGEYSGAFVNVFVIARTAEECRQAATASLKEDHFIVAADEDEPHKLSDLNWNELSDEFSAEYEGILPHLQSQSPVQYGTFHAFPKDSQDA